MDKILKILLNEKEIVDSNEVIIFWQQRFYAILILFTFTIGKIPFLISLVTRIVFDNPVMAIPSAILTLINLYFALSKKIAFKYKKIVLVILYYMLSLVILISVGKDGQWAMLYIVAFVSAGTLFEDSLIQKFAVFNALIVVGLTVFKEVGLLDGFGISTYHNDWHINMITVLFASHLLMGLLHCMVRGIKKQAELMHSGRNYLESIFEAINDGVIVLDKEWRFERWNNYVLEHFNLTEDLLTNKYVDDIVIAVETPTDQKIDELSTYLMERLDKNNLLKVYLEDNAFDITCKVSEITNNLGDSLGYVAIVTDMTLMRQEEMNIRHAQKMEAIGTMAGGIAHDFNNMLGGILGYSELANKSIEDRESHLYRYNQEIIKTAHKASDLTKQLLTYARKTELARSATNINDCVVNIVNLMERTVEKQVEIVTNLSTEPILIYGDASSLENAFLNLGINAKDAMPDGGKLTYSVSRYYLDEAYCQSSEFDLMPDMYAHIQVTDEGHGMSEELLERIFEPFFTTKEIGKGTGLGLPAAYGTVVAHKGAIEIKSIEKIGSCVDIYLPIHREIDEEEKQVESVAEEVVHNGRILLIDDEEVIRTLVQEILESLGYEVLVASDGIEGIKILEETNEPIRGILLDMIMPKMSGKEVFKRIKDIDSQAKVIMMSGYLDENHIDELYELGFEGFVKKPFTIESIIEGLSVL